MVPTAAAEIWPQRSRTADQPSGGKQAQANGEPKLPNPRSRTETEHPRSSSGSQSFNNYDSGNQFVNTGGTQYTTTGGNQFVGDVYGQINQTLGNQVDEARRKKEIEILKRLKASPYEDRKNRNPDRVLGTCDWFVSHKLFRDWQESTSSTMLWVSADPGCGKTVCYFFFKDDFEDQRSVTSALCCILYQLFKHKRILLSDAILDQFDVVGEKFTSSFGELWQAFINAAEDENADEIVCLLDAIDECEDQGRSQLTQALCRLYGTKRNFNLKFLLTSRPYGEIRRGFRPLEIPELPVIYLSGESDDEMEKISREIGVFIKARVQNIGEQLQLKEKEQDLLLRELMLVRNRTYIWVHLTLKLIESNIDIDKTGIVEAISQLPKSVDEAYDRILSRSLNSEKAKKILQIVVAAARPLTLREMNVALALRESTRSSRDLDLSPENRFPQDLRDGFTTLMIASYFGLRTAVKRLVRMNDVHLNSRDDTYQRPALSWAAGNGFDGVVKLLVKGPGISLKNPKLLFGKGADVDAKSKDGRTPLSYAVWNRSAAVVKLLIKAGARVDVEDEIGGTPLSYAVCNGRKEVIKLLLKKGSQADSEDGIIEKLLFSAAEKGHEEIVGLLLETGKADADAKRDDGQTPLWRAAREGHEAVVKLLLEKGANANAKDNDGWTPLLWAAGNGYEAVVKLLLEKGANADLKMDDGQTPLWRATRKGHEAVVKLLLEKGANANAKDKWGQTPLSWAVANRHEAIIKLLKYFNLELDQRPHDIYAVPFQPPSQ
ncbi:hypothetical protein DL771_005706 [Monosporascus sp. 5C6A]|nr:hypothetical protein DL771_005706 [Monosporascus sp. 5C6A]